MPIGVKIRECRSTDRAAVLAVVRHAFARGDQGGDPEVAIVRNVWDLEAIAPGLDLVAVAGDEVVGHVLGSVAVIGDTERAVAVAPLAVTPSRQRSGIGTQLMGELISRADDADWPLVGLLGDPAYYGRFGFEPGGAAGVIYEPVGAESPYFQIRRLRAHHPAVRGTFAYCWERVPPAT